MSWFPRFPRIRSKPSPTLSLPFNSSLQEVERLRELKAHPAWKHLQHLWERVAQAEYDRLGQGLEYDQYLAAMGAYQAARRTVDLVDTLIEKADAHHARERTTDTSARDHSTAIFYGSHLWR